MDWVKELPDELQIIIRRKVYEVNRIPRGLKMEIESQRFLFAKLMNEYLERNDYSIFHAMEFFTEDIGGHPETMWNEFTPEERIDFYHSFGPEYTERVMYYREVWNEWIENNRED